MSDDTVTIRFGARIEDLVKGVDGVKEKLAELGEMAKTVGELFAIGFGGREIIEFVKSMAELGERTERTAMQLGVSTEAVGELAGVAALTGTSMESFALSIERMSLNIQRSVRDGFSPGAQALKVLGLSAKELIGLSADEYFLKLSDAVSKFNPSLNLTNALMAIGGRGVAQMVPMLIQGREAFERYQAAIKATGSVLSEGTTKALVDTQHQIVLTGLSFQGLGVTIYEALKGPIDGVIESLKDLVQWFNNAMKSGGALSDVMSGISFVFKGLGVVLATAIAMFQLLATTAKLAGGIISGSMDRKEFYAIGEAINDIGQKWLQTMRTLRGGGAPGEAEHGEKGSAGAMDEGAKSRQAAAAAAIQEQIKAADFQYKMEQERVETAAKLFKMTEEEKTAALLAALNVRDAAEQKLLQDELALYTKGSVEYVKVLGKMSEEHGKFVLEREKETDKLVIEQQKSWETNLGQIQSAWDSQLKGLISKTTTWKEVMKNLFSDLVMAIIREFEKIVIIETLAKAMQSLFKGFDLTGIFKAIAANIALVYTEASAYLMPALGPIAAPVAAAAVAGTVGAVAGAFMAAPLPGAEEGAWNVPANSAWNLHKGETVLPATAAETFRNMASGGGPGGGTMNINIHAMDGTDALRVFTRHAATLSRVTQGHVAANPSSFG